MSLTSSESVALKRALRRVRGVPLSGAVISRLTKQVCALEIPSPLPKGVVLNLGAMLLLGPVPMVKGHRAFVTRVEELGRRKSTFIVRQKFCGIVQAWSVESDGVSGVFFFSAMAPEVSPAIDYGVCWVILGEEAEIEEAMQGDFKDFSEQFRRASFREAGQ